ncbi:transmembrane protein 170A-like [Watersipora subatra]|uniref:transmembrane protein 170A-like n=1 Tax=Watersipora subatra TaxID=2589382 RepID=UPI00355BACC6
MVPAKEIFVFPPIPSLTSFKDIWLNCFLFNLFSSLFVHAVAAIVAIKKLHKHQWGRFLPILIIIIGVISPLTYGALTSVAIAAIYKAAGFSMAPIYSLVWGVAQTVVIVFISFTRFLFTL